MAVFRDKTVPIPKVTGITINRSDGNRVLFVKEAPYDARAGYARPKRTTIGYVTNHDVKLMHPTSGYKLLFPSEWEKAFGEKVPAVFKHIGLYAISDSVNASTGIKDIMDQCFGADRANAMMDFVLYSMLYQTSVAEHFTTRMDGQQLFSATCHSDSYYSDLFKNKTSYDQILAFRKNGPSNARKTAYRRSGCALTVPMTIAKASESRLPRRAMQNPSATGIS